MTTSTPRSPVYDLLPTTRRLRSTHGRLHVHLLTFTPVSVDEMVTAVRALPGKCCALDPFPTSTLKTVVGELAPFLTELVNRSLSTGCVPEVFTPRFKKVDLDPSDVRSYRPISNLSVISKLLEKLVARQLLSHLNSTGLLYLVSSRRIRPIILPRRQC